MFRSARVLASARRALHARAALARLPATCASRARPIQSIPATASAPARSIGAAVAVPSHGGGGARTSHRSGGIVTISSITLASLVTTPHALAPGSASSSLRTKSSCCTSGSVASSDSGRQCTGDPRAAGAPAPRAKSVPGRRTPGAHGCAGVLSALASAGGATIRPPRLSHEVCRWSSSESSWSRAHTSIHAMPPASLARWPSAFTIASL
mmetsp:Transcript_7201/g.31769  ORF Transcript_7201/g.31769 Transcript_7201/m.31769 type:complete len:210 (+) Transcript_7201:846-1475(+)